MLVQQPDLDYDVVIIGAGISGLAFAYRLQERNPDLSYCVLDGRHEIGGTWSLFNYPGTLVREWIPFSTLASDSRQAFGQILTSSPLVSHGARGRRRSQSHKAT